MNKGFIYFQLPPELQRIVQSYFSLWARKGFQRQPAPLCPNPDLYFRTIRRPPKKTKWCQQYPRTLYYRRHRFFFKWVLRVAPQHQYEDVWSIDMSYQWGDIDNTRYQEILSQIYHTECWGDIPSPDGAQLLNTWLYHNHSISLEFLVTRHSPTSPPSRQEMAELFVEYVIQLAPLMEKTYKNIDL